jgi:hypothetical protein
MVHLPVPINTNSRGGDGDLQVGQCKTLDRFTGIVADETCRGAEESSLQPLCEDYCVK